MFDDDSRFECNTDRASFTCRATENKLRTTHVTFRSCLKALNSHPTTLIEIAEYIWRSESKARAKQPSTQRNGALENVAERTLQPTALQLTTVFTWLYSRRPRCTERLKCHWFSATLSPCEYFGLTALLFGKLCSAKDISCHWKGAAKVFNFDLGPRARSHSRSGSGPVPKSGWLESTTLTAILENFTSSHFVLGRSMLSRFKRWYPSTFSQLFASWKVLI